MNIFGWKVTVSSHFGWKCTWLLTRKTNCMHDLGVFPCNRVCEAVQGLSDFFNVRLQNDDVQDFEVRWDQALLSASDMPSDVILEGLYESKLQDSVQRQTVLALYDQETVGNNGQTSYLRLKTSVKLHVDENSKLQSPKRSCGKSSSHQESKRKESLRREESGRVFSVESARTTFERDSCCFSHDKLAQGDLCSGQRRKGRSSSPAPFAKVTDEVGEDSATTLGNKEESSSDKRSEIPCRYMIFQKKKKPSVM